MKRSKEESCVGDEKSWTSSFQLCSSGLNPTNEHAQPIHKLEASKLKTSFGLGTLESTEDNELKTLDKIPVTELSLFPPVASNLVGNFGASDSRSDVVSWVPPSGLNKVQLDSRNEMLMIHKHQQLSCRKQRRCWSPELHKAFVSALQELGGPQVSKEVGRLNFPFATPKQIRDLMRVEGLTNDEVKSHLQKYRLHIRTSPSKQMDSSTSQSTVVLGVSWNNQDHSCEFSKHTKEESGSPHGPLDLYPHHENDDSYD